jgi:processive 1,2-diacylglycerol beta-glucosyltransferase
VVVTSPGQTCHEARVVGRPLVLLDVVPGHGRENALHEIESGGAFACSPFPDSVVGVVEAILARPLELPKWPVASAQEWGAMFLATVEGSGVELGDSP